MRATERIDRLVRFVERWAAGFLLFITALTFVSVLLRYIFSAPIPDGYDVSRLMLGVAVFWGIAAAGYRDAHIQVDLVWSVAGRRGRWAIDLLAAGVSLAFLAAFAWMLVDKVLATIASGEQTFDLRLPIWPFYALASLGILLATALILGRLYRLAAHGAAERDEGGRTPGGA